MPAAGTTAQQAGASAFTVVLPLVERARRVFAAAPRLAAELVKPQVLDLTPPVEVDLYGDDLAQLEQASQRVAELLRGLGGLRDISSTVEMN